VKAAARSAASRARLPSAAAWLLHSAHRRIRLRNVIVAAAAHPASFAACGNIIMLMPSSPPASLRRNYDLLRHALSCTDRW